MRVVVTGATGNVGTALVRHLMAADDVDEVVGLARRPPAAGSNPVPGVRWARADVAKDDLRPLFDGADAVVHLAWLIQPNHEQAVITEVNVHGSRRVFQAAAGAGVSTLVHASSVGVYSPGPKDHRVDESWRRDGAPTSFYSRDKAHAEALLDIIEVENPQLRVVRLRPGLVFQRAAGSEIMRYFVGRFVPARLLRPGALPVLPLPRTMAFQAVHADDLAAAYHAAVVNDDARGAYNIAADPVLDPATLGKAFGARPIPMSPRIIRALVEITWRLHLQPTEPAWIDLASTVPLMSTDRARRELGWQTEHDAVEALSEVLAGIQQHADGGTPVLSALPALPKRVAGVSGVR